MTILTANLRSGSLILGDIRYPISCNVRQVKNGQRRRDEVIYSIPDKLPYDPQPFPPGLWEINGIEWQSEHKFDGNVYGPVKIRTNAFQAVKVWTLDKDGDYLQETKDEVLDHGYLLHYSESRSTLGCIRIGSAKEAILLAKFIQILFDQKEGVFLQVVYD